MSMKPSSMATAMPTSGMAMPTSGSFVAARPPMAMPTTGSFVAARPMASAMAQPMAVQEPVSLTAGIPDPTAIGAQKQAYEKSLDLQLQKEIANVQQQAQAKKQMVMQQAQQQVAAQSMAIDQEANAQIARLQEASVRHRSTLEKQASGIAMEYNMRKAQEDMMMSQYQIQQQYMAGMQKQSF